MATVIEYRELYIQDTLYQPKIEQDVLVANRILNMQVSASATKVSF